jgi:hypothetical protein
VSVKLTPEICINNTSSNSRLTAAGRQATATDTIHRTVSRLFFFFSLPTFDKKTTKLHLHAEKLAETVLHFNLGHCVEFFFCVCSFVLLYASPLMKQLYIYSYIYIYITIYISFIYLFFNFILTCILLFFIFNPLSLSSACSAYCQLVHYRYLFIPLKCFCSIPCFVFFYLSVYLFFPFL